MSDCKHPATFQAPELSEVARLFPSYEIHMLIACGGMGAVYQATQRSLDRAVAIKILPRVFSTDEEFRKGFESEAKAMAKLNHPNLIGVYDFGEVDGMLYIVMEYVAGKSLFHSSHGFAVDPADALRIVIDVCAGLAHAHGHGILHRDIKPANILLDGTASPKVGDFGLARAAESKIEEGEQIFGTPGYTAPEVLEPPFTFDLRADIFSVGVMLHELLTGKLPEDDPRPASQLSSCNQRLDAVIRKATNSNPALRYTSAAELAADLQGIANSPARAMLTSGTAAAPNRPYVPPTQAIKKSGSSGTGVVIFVLALTAAIALFALKKSDDPQPEPEVTETVETVKKDVSQSSNTEADREKSKENKPSLNADRDIEPEEPSFDTDAFLTNFRNTISRNLNSFTEVWKKEHSANTEEYIARLSVLVSELDLVFREPTEEIFVEESAAWIADSHTIPDELSEDLGIVPGAPEAHEEYLANQTKIDAPLAGQLKGQSGVYMLGIENQIAILKRSGDQKAINKLQKEVDRVTEEEDYFVSLFMQE